MRELPILNTTPLIHLARIGRLEVLRQVWGRVFVPVEVLAEVRRGAPRDSRADDMAAFDRVVLVAGSAPPPAVLPCGIGTGETAVFSWVSRHADTIAVVDDLAARRCAERLHIRFIGTIAALLRAKAMGHIPRVRPVLEALRDTGFRLSERLMIDTLALAGEAI